MSCLEHRNLHDRIAKTCAASLLEQHGARRLPDAGIRRGRFCRVSYDSTVQDERGGKQNQASFNKRRTHVDQL